MLHYTETTVFNVNAQTIVNTVNCVGAMGAGLALECKLRFPDMGRDYVGRCKRNEVKTGRPYLYRNSEDIWILNFPTKKHWRYPSKIEWIDEGLRYFSENYRKGGISSIAFPKLGCSNGELNWRDVSPLMEKYLEGLDIDVFICLDQEKQATGVEGSMVDLLNNMEDLNWEREVNLSSSVREEIICSLPVQRFRELRKVRGVGKQTYSNIFKLLYASVSEARSSSADVSQLQIQAPTIVQDESQKPIDEASSRSEFTSNAVAAADGETDENAPPGEDYDAFFIFLPYLKRALNTERTREEAAAMFKLPKSVVSDWLKRAEKLGKVKKLTRPVRYIATSSQLHQQLECELTTQARK